ncbi:MAG: biotin/lipoyl-binding protein [Desulfomonile tiedjei]|nr:biotin/lipoyl-binding protein [Desulfomonile tiedjei]
MKEARPRFRPDVAKHSYDEKHGGQTIVLEDPVANKFFRISPYEFELLRVLDGTLTVSEALEKLKLHGRYFTATHAAKLVEQFSRAGLLLGTGYGTSKVQTIFKNRMDSELNKRSIFKLYYLYIPLINPDSFLEKTLPTWRLLVNRFTATLFFMLIPGAAYLLLSGVSRLQDEFLFFFNLQNLFVLWIAIALVKLVHEFSHAYTAKSLGLRVPEMGVAFLIFFPCLYCNTTAAWQLADRRQRMSIALAGIISEMVLAVVSTYIWYFSKPGLLNSTAFYLMAISVISSLLFNGNPLLKFDGYFVLIDWLRMPNLQSKAFNYLRYLFLNRGLGIESVNIASTPLRDRAIYLAYGVSAALYRIFLYAGIIAGVYFRFDKTVGVILGALAFVLFVVRPLARSVTNLAKRTSEMNYRPRGILSIVALAAVILLLLMLPWSDRSVYPCYLESAMTRQIVIPAEAPVAEVYARQGDRIQEGQTILKLDPTPLQYGLKDKQAERLLVKKEISIIESSQKDLSRLPIKYIELSQLDDSVKQIEEDLKNIDWKAPFGGAVTKLAPTLQRGARPGKGTVVGEMASPTACEILGLVPEVDVQGMIQGGQVEVWFPIGTGVTFSLSVREVSPFKTEDLEGSPLSSRFGGEIATEVKGESGKDSPLEPHYICKLDFANKQGIPLGMIGRMVVKQPPRSAIGRMVNAAYRTFHREIVF